MSHPKLITLDLEKELTVMFGIEHKALLAIFEIEGITRGFDEKTGKIKIQFEPYWFQKYTQVRIGNNEVESQISSWTAFNQAFGINPEAAMLATSWGLGQIMGFNFKSAGYKSVNQMVDEFRLGEYFQLKGMLSFIRANKRIYTALTTKDWAMFAKHYNGPSYKQFNYDTRLATIYRQTV